MRPYKMFRFNYVAGTYAHTYVISDGAMWASPPTGGAEQPVPSVSFADISPHCGESPPRVISQYTVNKMEDTAR